MLKDTLWSYKVYDTAIELPDPTNLSKQNKLQCSSTYTSGDRKGHVFSLKNVHDLDVEGHALVVQGI